MKKVRWSLIALALIAVVCCAVSASFNINALYRITFHNAENLSEQRFILCGDELKLTGIRKNTVVANSVFNAEEAEFSFEKDIEGAAFCKSGFCAVSCGEFTEGLHFYDFYFQSFDNSLSRHINLSFEYPVDSMNFAVDEDFNLYVFQNPDGFEILKFSNGGRLLKKYTLDEQAEQLVLIGGKMHIVCGGALYAAEDDGISAFYTDDFISVPCKMTGTNILCDQEGKLFNINGDNAELCVDFNSAGAPCCITSKYCLSGSGSKLYGNNLENPEISAGYDFDFEILCLYYLEPYLYAGGYADGSFEVIRLTDGDINFTEPATEATTVIDAAESTAAEVTEPFSETTTEPSGETSTKPTATPATAEITTLPVTEPTALPATAEVTTQPVTEPTAPPATQKPTAQPTTQKPTQKPAVQPTTQNSTLTPTDQPATVPPVTEPSTSYTGGADEFESLKYSSEAYRFDESSKFLSGVTAETAVSKFKKNFECNGEIKVYDKSFNLKTSGNIGTGMTVIFTKDNESAAYTVSVTGDLTGEGNVNTLDLTAVFNHLLGIASLSPLQTASADLNGDGAITNKDLVLIKRLINESK